MEELKDWVLFIDAEAIVIDKPAGLAVHGGPRTRSSLEDRLAGLRFGFQRAPSPAHRLDRDTSGCLLLARNPKAHKRFARAFEEGLLGAMRGKHAEVLDSIRTSRDLPAETEAKLKSAVEGFAKSFS